MRKTVEVKVTKAFEGLPEDCGDDDLAETVLVLVVHCLVGPIIVFNDIILLRTT